MSKYLKYRLILLLCFLSGGINICIAQKKIISLDNNKIILENDSLRLVFANGSEFKFLEMSSPGSDRSWLPEYGDFSHLWEITLRGGPNAVNPEIKPMNCKYMGASVEDNETKASVTFLWEMRLNKDHYYPLRVIVSLYEDSGLSDWRIETDLPKEWLVSKVNFPMIMIQKPEQAKLIMPAGWGVEYELDAHSEYLAQYPSCTGSMQLLCVHNEDNQALYYATHDKDACIKDFSVKNKGIFTSISTEIIPSESWTSSNGRFSMPFSTSIGIDTKGWESAVVNWYRPFTFETVWGSKTFESRNLPKWVLNADMWLRPHFTTEETSKWLKEGLDFFGPQAACHWYRWHQIEYDVDYPEYFPAKDNFKLQMRQAQKMGSHVIPYINGRLWDPQSISYLEKNGKEHSCRKADGALYTEIYGSMIPNSVTCPSSKVWQDIIVKLSGRIQNELGSNGVYIDQIGAAPGVPCWNMNHTHPPGGGEFWHSSYRTLLEKVREGLLPGNIIITEENAECFMDLFDIMLMVNTPQYENVNIVPLYPLIYSDRMMLNCFLYYPLPEKVNSMTFRLKNVMGLLWGTQLGWIKPELIMASEAKEEAEFLKKLVAFRKQQHDLIYGGRLIKEIILTGDNPILEIPDMRNSPAVRGAYWIGASGNEAILLVNMDNVSHRIILPDGKERTMKSKECLRINLR